MKTKIEEANDLKYQIENNKDMVQKCIKKQFFSIKNGTKCAFFVVFCYFFNLIYYLLIFQTEFFSNTKSIYCIPNSQSIRSCMTCHKQWQRVSCIKFHMLLLRIAKRHRQNHLHWCLMSCTILTVLRY